MLTRLLAVAALAVASVSATDVSAQGFGIEMGDFHFEREVTEYVLTEDALSRVIQATRNLAAVRDSLHLETGLENTPGAELEDFIDEFVANAVVRRAVTAAGMEPREYVTFLMAAVHSMMVVMESDGADSDPAVPGTNARFLLDHQEAFGALAESMDQLAGSSENNRTQF